MRLDGSTIVDAFVYDEGWNEHAFAVSRPLGAHTLELSATTVPTSRIVITSIAHRDQVGA